jgi:hypothetical protein
LRTSISFHTLLDLLRTDLDRKAFFQALEETEAEESTRFFSSTRRTYHPEATTCMMRGEHCVTGASILSAIAVIMLIFVNIGQVNPGAVTSGLYFAEINVASYAALPSCLFFGRPSRP